MWLAYGTALLYNPYESFYNIQWRFGPDMILVLLYSRPPLRRARLLLLLTLSKYVKTQALRVQEKPVPAARFLEELSNRPGVLELLQLHVCLVLLDSVTDELCRASFTLRLDHHSLLLLASLVDNESRSLGLLLRDLLRLDGRCEFGGECKMLQRRLDK